MARKNRIKEICDAIAETKKILASPDVKTELLRETLENRELELLNDLYKAHKKVRSMANKTNTKRTTTMKEEHREQKTNITVSSAEGSK